MIDWMTEYWIHKTTNHKFGHDAHNLKNFIAAHKTPKGLGMNFHLGEWLIEWAEHWLNSQTHPNLVDKILLSSVGVLYNSQGQTSLFHSEICPKNEWRICSWSYPRLCGVRPNHKSGHMHTTLNFIAAQNKAGHHMHIQTLSSIVTTCRSSSQNSKRAENDYDDDNNNREFVWSNYSKCACSWKTLWERALFTVKPHFRREPVTIGNTNPRCRGLRKWDNWLQLTRIEILLGHQVIPPWQPLHNNRIV